ncbi:MAG: hypothetical protein KF777_00245 [Planctomycetaceae bacterium]|nr:hypothetical protein [Planctomycetaceae bacterium]
MPQPDPRKAIDKAVVLARILRSTDKIVAEAKQLEKDREELQRLYGEPPRTTEAVPC